LLLRVEVAVATLILVLELAAVERVAIVQVYLENLLVAEQVQSLVWL
jgi:hypothetical protein